MLILKTYYRHTNTSGIGGAVVLLHKQSTHKVKAFPATLSYADGKSFGYIRKIIKAFLKRMIFF